MEKRRFAPVPTRTKCAHRPSEGVVDLEEGHGHVVAGGIVSPCIGEVEQLYREPSAAEKAFANVEYDALEVPCPRDDCPAEVDEWCYYPSGRQMHVCHTARIVERQRMKTGEEDGTSEEE